MQKLLNRFHKIR